MAPIYDNGTSLGYEVAEQRLGLSATPRCNAMCSVARIIADGTTQMVGPHPILNCVGKWPMHIQKPFQP